MFTLFERSFLLLYCLILSGVSKIRNYEWPAAAFQVLNLQLIWYFLTDSIIKSCKCNQWRLMRFWVASRSESSKMEIFSAVLYHYLPTVIPANNRNVRLLLDTESYIWVSCDRQTEEDRASDKVPWLVESIEVLPDCSSSVLLN